MTIVSDVEIRLRADIARLQQDMTQARRDVTGALNAMSASAQAVKGLLTGLAAGLSVGAFASFIKNSIDAADALNDMSARTKVAIEDLAGLSYGAKLSDTQLEGVAASISKLSQNIGKDGAKFRELGITATEPLEAFKQLSDIFKNIQDPQQRAAFGAEVLGKSWQEAAVLLDNGAAGIDTLIGRGKELSGITEQVAADAGKFNDKLDELGFAAQGLGTRIAAGLLPTLQKIADSISATDVSGEKLSGTITVLAGALKGLYSAGVVVVEMFTTLGKAAGAAAAITVAALSGDFAGAVTIYKEMAADVGAGWGDAADKISGAWTTAAKSAEVAADAGDVIANKLIANATAVKVATFLNAAEIDAARKKSAADAETAAKKEQAAYAGLIASIKEKMAADQLEVDGAAAVTPVQQARIKLDQELAAGKIVLTKKHKDAAHALLDEAEALEKNAGAAKQARAAVAALADERNSDYAAIVADAVANENLVATYGKTKKQIEEMTLARLEARLAQRYEYEFSEDLVAQLEREIAARKRNAAAVGQLESVEKLGASNIALWKSIDDTAHATFVSILDGSKNTAQRLKDTFKNVFFDWLYQQTIKKWIINIGTSSSGGVGDIATALGGGASAGGAGSSAIGLINAGKTIYEGFTTGFAGAGGALGGYVTTLGNLFGSSATSAFGAGMGLTSSQAAAASAAYNSAGMASTGSAISSGSAAGAGVGIFAGAAAGYLGGNLISGQYGSKNTVAAGTAIGAAIGSIVPVVGTALGALVGGLLGGVANRLFGMGEKKVQSTMIEGSLTATGATGNNVSNWTQKGGWFRSDKKGTDSTALSGEQSAAFSSTYKAILDVSKVLGDTIGADTTALSTRVQKLSIDLTGLATDSDKLGAITKFFEGVADSIAVELVPNLTKFQKEGEALSVTMERIVTNYTGLDTMLAAVGDSFGAVGVGSIAAREAFIAVNGGLEKLGSGLSYFQQNFLTEAQQLAPVQKQLTDAFKAMGVAGITTNEQFATYLLGLDKTTEAGATMFAQLLALAPAFNEITKATEAAAKASQEAAKAAADEAIAKAQATAAAAQAAADALAQQLAANETALRAGVTAAYDALAAAVAEKKNVLADAYKATIAGIEDSIKSLGDSITATTKLSDTLKAGLVGDNTPAASAASYSAARAQLAQALADAQRSGTLPSADSIKDALAAVGRDNSAQFATLLDYQRSTAQVNNSIAGLAGAADTQLTVQERQLLVLQAQKDMATLQYNAEVERLDAALAYNKMMSDIALGQYAQLVTVNEGIGNVAAAIAALKNGATTSNPTGAGLTLDALYQAVLGRAPDAAGAAYWSKIFGDSIDSAEYANFVKGAQAELNGRGNSWEANPLYSPARASSADTAIVTLNAKLDTMQTAMSNTAAATQQLARQFDQVSANGNALLTEAAK